VPAGWRVIGRVLDGPARVLVDGAEWRGYAGWQSFGPPPGDDAGRVRPEEAAN
jgi:thiamine-monophosphate kinase